MQLPNPCTLCPRACRADRAHGQRGFCGADGTLRVARAALHHWEEPCLSGDPNAATGSGTVFFFQLRAAVLLLPELSHQPGGCGQRNYRGAADGNLS